MTNYRGHCKSFSITVEEIKTFHGRLIFNNWLNSINSGYTSNPTINYNPLEKIDNLYKGLMAEKDKLVALLIKENNRLKGK